MEPILPLLAVRYDGELERGAVEQDELDIGQCVHLLGLVAQFNVLCDGLVKVCHSGVLGSPTTEERILLNGPDHLKTIKYAIKLNFVHSIYWNMLVITLVYM